MEENKFRLWFKDVSQSKIYFFSILVGGVSAVRFLNRKYISREFHGHFNSPQNLLNRNLTKHYVQDSLVRFAMISLLYTVTLSTIKYNLGGYNTQVLADGDKTLSLNDDEEDYINPFIDEKKINESVTHRENVNKYLKK